MDSLAKLRRLLIARLMRRGTTLEDAEDAIQQAFVRLHAQQKKDAIHNPSAFLVHLVGKVRIERWRQLQRQREVFTEEPLDAIEAIEAIDFAPRPEDYVQADQRLDRIKRRLAELSPRTQQIFFLHRLEGLSYPQIAAAIGVSVSAIEKHIARAALYIQDEMQRE